ncbi:MULTISPECIES: twin-arginine translocase subunit TatC [Alteribacter]|uniref:Sec-independent protein translocase protein TatC n=1 Tax=Alteribacter keqinensis TaxID=2483800 RepID=A0A3M7TVC2_9BACI|nr:MULTISPECIES: twin-arginine translocase subunit TatC [Alteribacter]MBM7094578.1 twin-arginine translocase subunit TatC [Alteribacter salitolerans]RNA69211.1 twin-arginine translocase subunit TatC [Alteribacter keqinensis]
MAEQNMEMLDHLSELRKRIIIVLGSFILFFIVSFIFVRDIYEWLIKDLDMQLTILGPMDIIWIFFSIAGLIAFAATIPILLFQIWLFVKPALTVKETRVTLMYIPASVILFLAGLSFGYFVVLPLVLNFLLTLGDGMFQTMFTPDRYFQFVLRMTVPFSILFELPLVVMFLTSLGLITPYGLRKNRKYAFFAIVVISVLISPPDFISDILVIIPLVILYEVSITLSSIIYKRKIAGQNSEQL